MGFHLNANICINSFESCLSGSLQVDVSLTRFQTPLVAFISGWSFNCHGNGSVVITWPKHGISRDHDQCFCSGVVNCIISMTTELHPLM